MLHACRYDNHELLEFLLSKGADATVTNHQVHSYTLLESTQKASLAYFFGTCMWGEPGLSVFLHTLAVTTLSCCTSQGIIFHSLHYKYHQELTATYSHVHHIMSGKAA